MHCTFRGGEYRQRSPIWNRYCYHSRSPRNVHSHTPFDPTRVSHAHLNQSSNLMRTNMNKATLPDRRILVIQTLVPKRIPVSIPSVGRASLICAAAKVRGLRLRHQSPVGQKGRKVRHLRGATGIMLCSAPRFNVCSCLVACRP